MGVNVMYAGETYTQTMFRPASLTSIVEPLLLVVYVYHVVSFVYSQLALVYSQSALILSVLQIV